MMVVLYFHAAFHSSSIAIGGVQPLPTRLYSKITDYTERVVSKQTQIAFARLILAYEKNLLITNTIVNLLFVELFVVML